MALFTGVQHLCTCNIVAPLFITLANVWKASYTISASIFDDDPHWPPYSTDKFISCFVPVPSQRFFHYGEEIVITWSRIRWVRWMFQNLTLPATQEVRDSSSVTPCIVMKNDGVLYHQVSSFSAESMWSRSLRQSERTTARDLVQHKRWTYPCYWQLKLTDMSSGGIKWSWWE